MKGRIFVEFRDALEKLITDIFDINPHSKYSSLFAEIYSDNFDIRKRKLVFFVKNSTEKVIKHLRKSDISINIFR